MSQVIEIPMMDIRVNVQRNVDAVIQIVQIQRRTVLPGTLMRPAFIQQLLDLLAQRQARAQAVFGLSFVVLGVDVEGDILQAGVRFA